MPSFLDELKSKKNEAIREEQAENRFYDKLMEHKEEILDKWLQFEIEDAIGNIKAALSAELRKNPTADYVSVKYRDTPGVSKLQNVVKVFNEYGCDFDFIFDWRCRFNTPEERKRFEDLVKKMGLCSPDARVIWTDSDVHVDRLEIRVLPPLFRDVYGFATTVRRLSDFGKKYMEELKRFAAVEGIVIEYKTVFSFATYPVGDRAIHKAVENEKFLTASVRI